LTVVSLSLIGILGNFGKVVTSSREITLATHLAQEKVETIRALSFYQIMVTSDTSLDNNFSPPLEYDNNYYPPETIQFGKLTLYRRVFIEKTDTPTGFIENVGYPHPDTGLKRISVYVTWQRNDGAWKKITVSNLAVNPSREALDRRVYGHVTDSITAQPIGGALVQARRNPGWGSYTDSNGYFSFQATDNTMIVISNRYGYYEYTSPQFNINYGDNLKDFTMLPISSRTVTGYVITFPELAISQINNKWNAASDDEFIELYNGTSHAIDLGGYTLNYVDKWNSQTAIPMTWVNTTIPSHGYFLCLGSPSGSDTVAPDGKSADAYFTSLMNETEPGGVILKNSGGGVIDSVAWGNASQQPPSDAIEGDGVDLGGGGPGIGQGGTLVRKAVSTSTASNLTPPSGIHINAGNAWDTQDNGSDFVLISTAAPRNTSIIKTPQGGKGLAGAVVSADDGISASTEANISGYFALFMATGPWTVSGASTTVEGQKSMTVTLAGPNTVIVLATTTATFGFVKGRVLQFGSDPFPNMLVRADPGGQQAYSNSQGVYSLALPAGEEYFITGNPDFFDPDWNTAVTPDAIPVQAGLIVDSIDLKIWINAYVSGRVTTNGVDGLPGVAVVASGQFSNGNTSITDGNGNYTISGLRLIGNPYTVYPVLLEGQTSSPADYHGLDLTQGNNLTGQNFQITGAFVTISGTATITGQPITSGVNVIASTVTINTNNPPDISFALRNGSVKYYQAITDNSGHYSMPVLGGSTYNLVAWYTTTSTTTAKTLAVTVASNIGNPSCHFSWP